MNIAEFIKLSNEGSIDALAKKLENQDANIKKNAQQIYAAIQNQSIESHPLLFLYCISGLDVNVSFNVFDRFLKSLGDGKQVSFKIDKLYRVADDYKRFMIENGLAVKAIKALECACKSLEKDNLGLTRIHSIFVETCLRAKMYNSALRIIEKPLIHLESRSKIDEVDFFAYQYYSGCVYIGLKRFSEARECFNQIVMMPQKELYQINLDSQKKLFFLNVRARENNQITPAQNYDLVSTSIVSAILDFYRKSEINLEKYDSFLTINQQELAKEGNLGLAKQARISLVIKEVCKLSTVYLRVLTAQLERELNLKISDISAFQYEVNKVERLFKINRKQNCIEFLKGEEIDHYEEVLTPLKKQFELLKSVKGEYQSENEKMLLERIQTPDTIIA